MRTDVTDKLLRPKPLRAGEIRFVPRPRTLGRNTTWNVYDRSKGSYPVHVPGFGKVEEGFRSEQDAQREADRLTKFVADGGTV
jgi:hypothetical protein